MNDFEKLSAANPDVEAYWHFQADSQRLVGRLLASASSFPKRRKPTAGRSRSTSSGWLVFPSRQLFGPARKSGNSVKWP